MIQENIAPDFPGKLHHRKKKKHRIMERLNFLFHIFGAFYRDLLISFGFLLEIIYFFLVPAPPSGALRGSGQKVHPFSGIFE